MKMLYCRAFSATCLMSLSVSVWILKYRPEPATGEKTMNSSSFRFSRPRSSLHIDGKVYSTAKGINQHVLSKIEEIHDRYTPGSFGQDLGLSKNPHKRICSKGGSGSVEDLLCMTPLNFLQNFTNPCWYAAKQRLVCLPYFQLIGVGKCGTSDLFTRLCIHPDVLPNMGTAHKETAWWSWKRYGRKNDRLDNYLNYFAEAATTINKTVDGKGKHIKVTGDGSPMDFWDLTNWPRIPQNFGLMEPTVLTPHLLRHVNPDVKLILLFRDPIETQYSDYWFVNGKIKNKSAETFHSAVLNAIDVLHGCTRSHSFKWCLFDQDTRNKFTKSTRLNLGFYSVNLREWLKVFPRDQFLVLQTEDYSENMSAQMRRVFSFLKLRDLTEIEMTKLLQQDRYHETKAKRNAKPMLQETRQILHKLYDPFCIELAAILNDNTFAWNSTFVQ